MGHKTFDLLPSILERQELKHLNDIDHGVVQLLTGHGPFKSYLKRFKMSETDTCEDCGQVDDAFHALLFYITHEDIRDEL